VHYAVLKASWAPNDGLEVQEKLFERYSLQEPQAALTPQARSFSRIRMNMSTPMIATTIYIQHLIFTLVFRIDLHGPRYPPYIHIKLVFSSNVTLVHSMRSTMQVHVVTVVIATKIIKWRGTRG
jgi:hypothetical protein